MATRAYRELRGEETRVWDEFYAMFDFRPRMHRFPAIVEPTPSVTWGLTRLDDDPADVALDRLTEVVQTGFASLVGEGSLLCLDWQHPCYRVWPRLIGPENLDPPGQPGCHCRRIPDGDYHIYLAEDLRFGSFGHPWEPSLCIFGLELLDAIAADVHVVLRHVIRRDGRPATA